MSVRKSAKKEKLTNYNSDDLSRMPIDTAFSDSEAMFEAHSSANRRGYGQYYQLASSLPDMKNPHMFGHNRQSLDGNYTDEDQDNSDSYLDFGNSQAYGTRNVRTGRQRKKLAARSKGGEFQTKRRKRRVYFCCIASEIDVQKLYDHLNGAAIDFLFDWKFELNNDVLHMYKPGLEEQLQALQAKVYNGSYDAHDHDHERRDTLGGGDDEIELATTPKLHHLSDKGHRGIAPVSINQYNKERIPTINSSNISTLLGKNPPLYQLDDNDELIKTTPSFEEYLKTKVQHSADHKGFQRQDSSQNAYDDMLIKASINHKPISTGYKEVFIFDFGAAVFWGFSRGEEVGLLKTIRMFVTKGMVGVTEFESGEDDMAFVISPEDKEINIANDVISLPEDTLPKQRLAVSFAIAQSSVLAIFEARIEHKVDEYKYIPEALAAYGKVQLSERQLGMMIGEVFVIRHDVNLHTEILDTPDFFWKEKIFEGDYKMVSGYLEMSSRTEILNKRLDMLRELLDVLQQQMENAHAVKLEWIVIYLIVAEVLLQGLAIISKD